MQSPSHPAVCSNSHLQSQEPAKIGAVGPALLPAVIASPDWLFNNVFLKAWKIDAKARSSMADDLKAGRKTEIDYINGELVALADRLGAGAPVNRRIVELIRKAEGGAEPWSPAPRTSIRIACVSVYR